MTDTHSIEQNIRSVKSHNHNATSEKMAQTFDITKVSGESSWYSTGIVSARPKNTELKRKQSSNLRKWTLKKYAEMLMPNTRQSYCMRRLGNSAETISLYYDKERKNAHYQGCAHCDNVWSCPVCSATISARRCGEIQTAIDQWHGASVMFTYTMRHKRYDDPKELIDQLRAAYRKFWKDRAGRQLKEKMGLFGGVTSIDITYHDRNGWHIHIHQLALLDPDKSTIDVMNDTELVARLDCEMSKHWQHCLRSFEADADLEHGFFVSAGEQFRREYVAKFGREPESQEWTLASELTLNQLKKSNRKDVEQGLHPFQILERSKGDKKSRYARLWDIYIGFTKGRNQLNWSRGLKAFFGIDDLSDEQVIEQDNAAIETKEMVTEIPYPMWEAILHYEKRAKILNVCVASAGDTDKVRSHLRKYYHRYRKVVEKRQREREEHERSLIRGTIWDRQGNSYRYDQRPDGATFKPAAPAGFNKNDVPF